MSSMQSAKETALCGAVVLAVWFSTWLAGSGSALVQTTAALPVEQQPAALLVADTERADPPPLAAMGNATLASIDVTSAEPEAAMAAAPIVAADEPEAAMAAATPAAPDEPNTAAADEPSMVVAALPDSAHAPAAELPLVQAASVDPSDPAPAEDVRQAVRRIEILDECLVADICIDQFLWALYQRTLKQDTNKVREQRKVTVKRKGRMVTVTRSVTRLVNQDFTWKDPDAAERAGMSMMDYVIGGMDRSFKTKLFHALHAAEQAGLSPGITSAFRDDYRQSITTGTKAATGRSFHGGSLRGGYGHGLAADVVSVEGATRSQRWASTAKFWSWIDAHGKEFGIGRPYLGRDPPHVAPIDGREYAAHNRGMRAHAHAHGKKPTRLAMRDGAAKKPGKRKVVQNSAGPIKQGAISDRPKMAMAAPGRG